MRRGQQSDAASRKDLDSLMGWLEDYCTEPNWFSTDAPFAAFLEQTPKLITAHSAFRQLAGQAMDLWDHMDGHGDMRGKV